LEKYFDLIITEFNGDLKPVIEGKSWIKIDYDPRDDY